MIHMDSPFPGMDPYLEGEHWQSFHASFTCELAKQLSSKLPDQYLAWPYQHPPFSDVYRVFRYSQATDYSEPPPLPSLSISQKQFVISLLKDRGYELTW